MGTCICQLHIPRDLHTKAKQGNKPGLLKYCGSNVLTCQTRILVQLAANGSRSDTCETRADKKSVSSIPAVEDARKRGFFASNAVVLKANPAISIPNFRFGLVNFPGLPLTGILNFGSTHQKW